MSIIHGLHENPYINLAKRGMINTSIVCGIKMSNTLIVNGRWCYQYTIIITIMVYST